ncbi:hypothetical protein HGRIS_010569 [Hohenbuehelia grisea]|uniref:Uncharacterized protein n=1 Tax=Hohenbuehelia grisea TaxID=104357 RepID=A0ABR3IXF9_9AGAR
MGFVTSDLQETQPKRLLKFFWLVLALLVLGFVHVHQGSKWYVFTTGWPDSTLGRGYSAGDVVFTSCAALTDKPVPRDVDCGVIFVPKNYFDKHAGLSGIAFARRKSENKIQKKGTVFLNPGGPGGSGVLEVLAPEKMWGQHRIPTMIGPNYDVIGFDIRGVAFTRPKTECLNEDEKALFHANTVLEQGFTVSNPLNASKDALKAELVPQYRQFLALKQVQSQICAERMGDELNHFFGASYGTILGSYLVNMFPERIGRVVIDGVATPDLWSTTLNHKWPHKWLVDAEATFERFLRDCAAAGPSRCALAQFPNQPWDHIRDRIDAYFDDLALHPLPLPSGSRPGYLTSGLARSTLYIGIEIPKLWPKWASLFGGALSGDARPLYDFAIRQAIGGYDYARTAVSCADAPESNDVDFPTPEDLAEEAVRTISEVSPRFGVSIEFSEPDGGCQFWPYRSPGRFSGPWNATLATPMLIVSNTLDPITPKANGLWVHEQMPNSSLMLIQDGPGHTAMSMDSACTFEAIHNYFAGILPRNGTVCLVDEPDTFSEEGLSDGYALDRLIKR